MPWRDYQISFLALNPNFTPTPRASAPAPTRDVGRWGLGPLLVGPGQVVGASFRTAGLAGPSCTGDRVLGAVGPAWRVTLAAVDVSSAWRVHTIPRAAPRVPGSRSAVNALDSGVRGWGSGASRGLGRRCPGCVRFDQSPAAPQDPGSLPILRASSDRAAGTGQGACLDVLGSRLTTGLLLGPRGAAAGASRWAVGSGWPRAVPGGRGWGGVPLADSGAGRQEARSDPRLSVRVSGGLAGLCWGAGV